MSTHVHRKNRLVPMPDNTSGRIITHHEWMMTQSAEQIAYMNNMIQENINWRADCVDTGHFIPSDSSITSAMIRNIDYVLPDGFYYIINDEIPEPREKPSGFPDELIMAFLNDTRQKQQQKTWIIQDDDINPATENDVEWEDTFAPPSE